MAVLHRAHHVGTVLLSWYSSTFTPAPVRAVAARAALWPGARVKRYQSPSRSVAARAPRTLPRWGARGPEPPAKDTMPASSVWAQEANMLLATAQDSASTAAFRTKRTVYVPIVPAPVSWTV
jgi:hypothetical protein